MIIITVSVILNMLLAPSTEVTPVPMQPLATTNGVKYLRHSERILLNSIEAGRPIKKGCIDVVDLDFPLTGRTVTFLAHHQFTTTNGVGTFHIDSHYTEPVYTREEQRQIRHCEKQIEALATQHKRAVALRKGKRSEHQRRVDRQHYKRKAAFEAKKEAAYRAARKRLKEHHHILLLTNCPAEDGGRTKVGVKVKRMTVTMKGLLPTFTIHGVWMPH
jgi:hypothetical protein